MYGMAVRRRTTRLNDWVDSGEARSGLAIHPPPSIGGAGEDEKKGEYVEERLHLESEFGGDRCPMFNGRREKV
jgi:hypothetical protein